MGKNAPPGVWGFFLFSLACLCFSPGMQRKAFQWVPPPRAPTTGAGSFRCASVCVWALFPPSLAHLWQEVWMTSCSGTLLAFDLEFPAVYNVFGNTRTWLRGCWGGRCGCLLAPVFPGRLLPTAPGFPLSRLLPGQALAAGGCSEQSTDKHKKTPPCLCFQPFAGSADFMRCSVCPGR